jgi:hypothetical protein
MAAIALVLPWLQGCAGAMVAAQVVPAAMGTVAMTNVAHRDPFVQYAPGAPSISDQQLTELDERVIRAECGDPESQFWLATTLKSNRYTAPDNIEIYKWYRLAEMGAFTPATEQLAALDAAMSGPDITQARTRASAWQPATEGCPGGS